MAQGTAGVGGAAVPGSAVASIGGGLEAALAARRAAWFASLDEGLAAMRARGVEPAVEDEAFLSAVAAATRIGMEAHGAAKLDALRSVVLNTAAGVQVDELSRAKFMGFLGQLSDLHLRVLRVLKSPRTAPEVAALDGGGVGSTMEWIVRLAFLPFAPLYAIQAAIKDLEEAGLILPLHRLQVFKLTEAGSTGACVTPLGERFHLFTTVVAGVH